eukprot:6198459-Pleurochrysis_carterae.AAC.3
MATASFLPTTHPTQTLIGKASIKFDLQDFPLRTTLTVSKSFLASRFQFISEQQIVALPIAALLDLVDALVRLAAVGVLALSAEWRRTRILQVAHLSGGDQRPFTKNALERDRDGGALALSTIACSIKSVSSINSPFQRRPRGRQRVLKHAISATTPALPSLLPVTYAS